MKGNKKVNPLSTFRIQETSDLENDSYTKIEIISEKKQDDSFEYSFHLKYANKKKSKVKFSTREFYIDEYGNATHSDLILFEGDISDRKMGDMLPMDFVYDKK